MPLEPDPPFRATVDVRPRWEPRRAAPVRVEELSLEPGYRLATELEILREVYGHRNPHGLPAGPLADYRRDARLVILVNPEGQLVWRRIPPKGPRARDP
jgi:hypothetical protein